MTIIIAVLEKDLAFLKKNILIKMILTRF